MNEKKICTCMFNRSHQGHEARCALSAPAPERQVWTEKAGYDACDGRDADRSALSYVPKGSGPLGFSHHHRRYRSRGPKDPFLHSPANLVLLMGSGSSGEHAWVHQHGDLATILGYSVPSGIDPTSVPVWRMNQAGTGFGWWLQTHDAQLIPSGPPGFYPEARIAEALRAFEQIRLKSRREADPFHL